MSTRCPFGHFDRSAAFWHDERMRLSLSIRVRAERDVDEIVGWVPDAAALYLFAGPRLTWPLTASQLQGMVAIEGLTPSVVVASSGELVGHFDLTVDGQVARLGRVIVNPALRGRGLAGVIVSQLPRRRGSGRTLFGLSSSARMSRRSGLPDQAGETTAQFGLLEPRIVHSERPVEPHHPSP